MTNVPEIPDLKNTKDAIRKAMAKAFFASAWADLADQHDVNLSGCEIFDVMPDVIDPAAYHAADTLIMDTERENTRDIATLHLQNTGDLSPSDWGHYAAMSAMGHGVGLYDYTKAVRVPYVEFGDHSLERDYLSNEEAE